MLFLVWNHLFIYFAMLVFILHVGNFFLISSLGIKKKKGFGSIEEGEIMLTTT